MNRSKAISSFFLAALLASTALAQEPKPLMDEAAPAISVSDTAEINAADAGLLSPTAAQLPNEMWKEMSDDEWLALLRGIGSGIPSAALRNLTVRALATSAPLPDSAEDLLAERVDALLRLGQVEYAQKLLAQIPKAYRKPRHDQMAFQFKAMENNEGEAICKEATSHLDDKASPFWQRWVVLCQAKSGEKDKAQLGLDLLSEQNEYSEFYQKIVQNMLSGNPSPKLPEVVYLEQAAWLIFSGQSAYLHQQKTPPLALASLLAQQGTLPDEWKKTAARYGLPKAALEAPQDAEYAPEASLLTLSSTKASDAERRTAFLAYGLRKALDRPVSLEAEESLRAAYYRATQVVTSPAWRQQLSEAAAAKHSGKVILLLAGMFKEPLSDYAPADIAAAVDALTRCGLAADAAALAKEAMEAE